MKDVAGVVNEVSGKVQGVAGEVKRVPAEVSEVPGKVPGKVKDATQPAFRIDPLPRELLERVWATGRDDAGNAVEVMVNDRLGSAPLRCCLREAAEGERIALIACRPFDRPGLYAEVGPVFVHAEPCAGYADVDRYPEAFRHRRQVFRAYDAGGRQVYDANALVEGREAEAAIARILADPRVSFIHSRNVLAGCYMFTIRRP